MVAWAGSDPPAVAHLVSLGALAQVTAMSLTGDFGRRAQADASRLIEMGLVHFVASDAHDLKRRPPGLGRAWEAIAERWGEEAARELLADNPRAVVAGLPLPSQVHAAPREPAGNGEGDEADEVAAPLRFTPSTR